jgi:hypothetical protein
VQSNLCTFSQSPSQLRKANKISVEARGSRSSQNRYVCAAQIPPTNKQSKQQNSIAHTIHQHCLLSGFGPAQAVEPKSNLQIATHTNHFPTYHECNDVIGTNQQQHRSGKQALIALETRAVRVLLHISQTVKVHAKAHRGYCDHHSSTLRVKTLQPVYSLSVAAKPGSLRDHVPCGSRYNFIKTAKTQHCAIKHTKYCHKSPATSTKPSTS